MSTNISLVSSLLLILIQIKLTNSTNITCKDDGLCRGKPIICDNNEDCYISCNATNACYYSIVQCPIKGVCDIFCGIDRNSCDDIIINATQSTLLHMYCADNECDDAKLYCPYNGLFGADHQCILEGTKTIDRIKFYTQEGFNDINISNIALSASTVFCGEYNTQYECSINTAENGCVSGTDHTCETYRLPSVSPTLNPLNPTIIPTLSPSLYHTFVTQKYIASNSTRPTNIPTLTPSLNPTEYQRITDVPTFTPTVTPTVTPTATPTYASVEIHNNEQDRLEFYIYYNDTNGVNMILGKWMKEELLHTYNEFATTSSANTEWNVAGLLNLTFCAVFNEQLLNNAEHMHCKRFTEYGYYQTDLNIPIHVNAQYVAYGTFGIYSDVYINSFQLFVIDTFTSYLFKQSFNTNMNNRINSIGFDDEFEAIYIAVQPFDTVKQNSVDTAQKEGNSDKHINIILGVLIGILVALTVIVCIYTLRYYYKLKAQRQKRQSVGQEGVNDSKHTTPNEHTQLKALGIFSVAPPTITLGIDTIEECENEYNLTLKNHSENDPYLTDDKEYFSSDNDTESHSENEHKSEIISDDNHASDSGDTKSVISAIFSFGKRHKPKQKKVIRTSKRKQKRSQSMGTLEPNIKHFKPNRKRSLHWGFTDDGCKNGEIDSSVHRNSDATLSTLSHLKSPCLFTMNSSVTMKHSIDSNCNETLPEIQLQHSNGNNSIKQLELARNSSYASHNQNMNILVSGSFSNFSPNHSSQSGNNNMSLQTNKSQHLLSVDSIMRASHDHTLNDAQFLAALSPSINSMEDMYSTPATPDGIGKWTGQSNSMQSSDIIFKLQGQQQIEFEIKNTSTLPHIVDTTLNNCDYTENKETKM